MSTNVNTLQNENCGNNLLRVNVALFWCIE